jgi:CO/xanthine dehydrogenase FAD-binding subunit
MATFYRRWPKFDYLMPRKIDEVLDALQHSRDGSHKVYAGGTDVIPKMKRRLIKAPEVLIDLKGVSDLDYIEYDGFDGLKIGPLTTVSDVADSKIVKDHFPLLAQAANSIASRQIRNRATIAGNICNAVPSADSAPALLCLESRIICSSLKGSRTIEMGRFFTGPNQTVLKPDEILKEIQVPNMPERSKGVYLKLSTRSRMDLALVGVAAILSLESGSIRDARIGLGAVAPTPMRAKKAEESLVGNRISEETIEKAAKLAAEESKPISDHRASAEYRKMMVEVLVKRALHQVLSD